MKNRWMTRAGAALLALSLWLAALSGAARGEETFRACEGVLAAGNGHVAVLKRDGTVTATGENLYGQCDVAEWKDIVRLEAKGDFTVGWRADGSWVVAGGGPDLSWYRDELEGD